tara:strand:+ start:2448 stop:2696 length:249 start_codon:yes stop_codon:yes gene_type:complete
LAIIINNLNSAVQIILIFLLIKYFELLIANGNVSSDHFRAASTLTITFAVVETLKLDHQDLQTFLVAGCLAKSVFNFNHSYF